MKKLFAFWVSLAIFAAAMPTNAALAETETPQGVFASAESDEPVLYGDVDFNGRVNLADALLIAKSISASGFKLSDEAKPAADVYKDGKINVFDVLGTIQFMFGEVTSLPIIPSDVEPPETLPTTSTSIPTTTLLPTTTTATSTTTLTTTTTSTTTLPTTSTTNNDTPAYTPNDAQVREVIKLINDYRATDGLAPLVPTALLVEAAQIRSDELLDKFDATRPDGSSYSTVLKELGIEYKMSGQNIIRGYNKPADLVKALREGSQMPWNEGLTHIGVAYNYEPALSTQYYWAILYIQAPETVVTNPTAPSTTTSGSAPTTPTTPNPSPAQPDLYRYIYGVWLNNTLDVIEKRAGLTLYKDIDVPISIEDLEDSQTLAMCGTEGSDYKNANSKPDRFRVKFNSRVITLTTVIDNVDKKISNTNIDITLAHELTHGMSYLNATHTVINSVSHWYMEGLAEATAGGDRLSDFVPNRLYSYPALGLSSVQSWEILKKMVSLLDVNSNDVYVYYSGNYMCQWLDNYGKTSGAGEYTSANGGRIAALNAELANGVLYSQAVINVFGKTEAQLLAEFKNKFAALTTYDEFSAFAAAEMNVQTNDGKIDVLTNDDATESDIIPDNGTPLDVATTNTIVHDNYNVQLVWKFD